MITGVIKKLKYGQLPDFNEKGEQVEIPDDATKNEEGKTAFARYMEGAAFLIPTPQVLQKIVTGLDDLYDYDLSINKYKKVEYVAVEYPPTSEIELAFRDNRQVR